LVIYQGGRRGEGEIVGLVFAVTPKNSSEFYILIAN